MARIDPKLAQARQEAVSLRRYLADLVVICEINIERINGAMKGPSTPERGKVVEACLNDLELQKGIAKRFGLGVVEKGQK